MLALLDRFKCNFSSPEYPQSPAAQRNRPATMRISGSTSHCEDDVLAGQRNAAKGKDGVLTRASGRERTTLSEPLPVFLPLRLGLCGEGLGIAIFTTLMRCRGSRNSWIRVGVVAQVQGRPPNSSGPREAPEKLLRSWGRFNFGVHVAQFSIIYALYCALYGHQARKAQPERASTGQDSISLPCFCRLSLASGHWNKLFGRFGIRLSGTRCRFHSCSRARRRSHSRRASNATLILRCL